MEHKVIDGKEISASIRKSLKIEVDELKAKGLTPGLAVVLVGDNPASRSYVLGKQRACAETGMHSELIELPVDVSEEVLLSVIATLNERNDINGILVQLPLPKQIDEQKVISAIIPEKDVDGFHPINVGKMMIGEDTLLPCTPFGILQMLKYIDATIEGKHAVVIGRSNIVGKPVGQLLLRENATVTYCHSRTANIKEITKQADILIVAIGREKFVKKDFVKQGAIVIDVGMNRMANGKLCGDVDYDEVKTVAQAITPVPGGVGPMTITMLLHNTLKACKIQSK